MKYENFSDKIGDEPRLFYCDEDVDIPAGATYGPVIRDCYIVECCTEGKGSVIINDREFFFSKGSSFVVLPGQKTVHTADPVISRRGFWCAVGGSIVGRELARIGVSADQPFLDTAVFEPLSRLLMSAVNFSDGGDMGTDLRSEGFVYTMLGIMQSTTPATGTNYCVKKALRIMEAKYYTKLSVDSIAKEVGLERCYFSTLFKSEVGKTPHAYLTELRLRKATALIKSGYSVSLAAESVGLSSVNIARQFKQFLGYLPCELKGESKKDSAPLE